MAQKHVLKVSSLNSYFKDELKLVEKGENAMESGHVVKMVYNETLRAIKGSVHASMKDKMYQVEIFLNDDNTISHSTCTCPRGQLSCHHVAALGLFAHYNLSITDQSCSWSAPKINKNNGQMVKTIDEMYPSKEYQASKRKVTEQEINSLREELDSFGGAVGFSWLLTPNVESINADIAVNIAGVIFSSEFQNSSHKCDYFKDKVKLSEEEILHIFELTTGQSKNPLWLTVRKFRLTASNFGAVLNACRRNSYPPSLYKRLTGTYNLDGVKAVQWGCENEASAALAFTEALGMAVKPAGLYLHPCGYLGASPDGLVGNDALIEIKCPFKYRNCDLIEALSNDKKYICIYNNEEKRFIVNEQHEYFQQIQGQLHILDKKKCYLVIWTPSTVVVLEVLRNEEWAENIAVLQHFYLNRFLDYLLNIEI